MRARVLLLAFVTVSIAGCGGTHDASNTKPPPKLPRALAQSWAQQADSVAAALAAGDGCTARQRANALRTDVVQAANAHRVPRRYLEPLVGTANDLAVRIACTPPAPVVVTKHGHAHEKHGNNGKHGDGGD